MNESFRQSRFKRISVGPRPSGDVGTDHACLTFLMMKTDQHILVSLEAIKFRLMLWAIRVHHMQAATLIFCNWTGIVMLRHRASFLWVEYQTSDSE
mmetsp:Transcript_41194/g.99243  ORF Transcript_41194/g.99243 Transcript_41194/m.99243 type:complete len:96 (+) Transcript_41194:1739-2026(+)